MTRVSVTRQINVRDASLRPAWRQGMAPWEWKELAGTAAFSGKKPTDTRYGARDSRLQAWNGFAAKARAVYIAGMGGHGDYAGNEAYKLDLDQPTPEWVMLREPSAWDDLVESAEYYTDGRPSSAHLYYSLWMIGNSIFRIGNGANWGAGSPKTTVDEFDLALNDWVAAETWPRLPTVLYYYAACQDPRDEAVYWCGGNRVYRRDPTTGVSTEVAVFSTNATAASFRASALDTTRERMVIFGDAYRTPLGGLLCDIAAGTLTPIDFSSADSDASAQLITAIGYHSAWYDEALDRFILKTTNTNKVYLIHPTTWVVTEQATTGGDSITNAANGINNKFVRVPGLGGIFYQPNHASNGWFLATE